jgi:cytochrome c6
MRFPPRQPRQYLTILLLMLCLWCWPTAAQAAETTALELGAKVFQTECAACHAGGGNIIRRGKNLKRKALERHHVDTLEAVQTLVTLGKGPPTPIGYPLRKSPLYRSTFWLKPNRIGN